MIPDATTRTTRLTGGGWHRRRRRDHRPDPDAATQEEAVPMITVLALVVLVAVHGAVVAASARRNRVVLAPSAIRPRTVPLPVVVRTDRPSADVLRREACPPPVDLAEHRRRRHTGASNPVLRDGSAAAALGRRSLVAVPGTGAPWDAAGRPRRRS